MVWMCLQILFEIHMKGLGYLLETFIIGFGHCSNIVRLMYEMYVNFVQSWCEISANFVWNTCEKSVIAVGNVVIGFGHCSIIVLLNVCEFCSNFHLKRIRNNIILRKSVWKFVFFCPMRSFSTCAITKIDLIAYFSMGVNVLTLNKYMIMY